MYSIDSRVTTSMTDSEGRLKLFSALQLMQDCSEMWFESEPECQKFFSDNHRAQLLVFRQVEIVRTPTFGERLTTTTSVFEMHPLFGFRNTFIYGSDGQPCYRTWSMGAFVDRETGQLDKLPDKLIATMAIEPRKEMNYASRRIAKPKTQPETFAPIAVERNDIDYNKHVNNPQYVRMALELLPADLRVSGLRIDYKRPARLGQQLTPRIYADAGRHVVEMLAGNDVCTLMEFT